MYLLDGPLAAATTDPAALPPVPPTRGEAPPREDQGTAGSGPIASRLRQMRGRRARTNRGRSKPREGSWRQRVKGRRRSPWSGSGSRAKCVDVARDLQGVVVAGRVGHPGRRRCKTTAAQSVRHRFRRCSTGSIPPPARSCGQREGIHVVSQAGLRHGRAGLSGDYATTLYAIAADGTLARFCHCRSTCSIAKLEVPLAISTDRLIDKSGDA